MILDRIDNVERYYPLHPGFKPAFEYLKTVDLENMTPGSYIVDGKRLYVKIVRRPGKGIEKTKLEAHTHYIDIQCTITGADLIGWQNIKDCTTEGQGYNEEKDVEFFPEKPEVWVKTPPGTFAIFFPEDMHAPEGSEEEFFKVIIKVAVNW
ncbi:YhcH/YjgK/YiaL family protein [Candidatus Latescibacterota bacterium]